MTRTAGAVEKKTLISLLQQGSAQKTVTFHWEPKCNLGNKSLNLSNKPKISITITDITAREEKHYLLICMWGNKRVLIAQLDP